MTAAPPTSEIPAGSGSKPKPIKKNSVGIATNRFELPIRSMPEFSNALKTLVDNFVTCENVQNEIVETLRADLARTIENYNQLLALLESEMDRIEAPRESRPCQGRPKEFFEVLHFGWRIQYFVTEVWYGWTDLPKVLRYQLSTKYFGPF